VSVLAAIRDSEFNFPLLVHVAGAALLVGSLTTAVVFYYAGWGRDRDAAFARLAFRTLLFVALPAWFVMRIGGQWIESKYDFPEGDEPAWLGIGYVTADLGGAVLLLSIILAGFGVRQVARSERGAGVLVRIATVLVTLIVLAYILAAWAMAGKPD
jgi:hypothetical protein